MEPLVPTGSIVIMKRIHNIDELKRGDIVHWNFPSYTSIPSNTSTLGIVVGLITVFRSVEQPKTIRNIQV